jgi:hypothetical protein
MPTKAKRAVALADSKSKITTEMKKLAVEFHLENQKANEHSLKADKAREKLYAAMKEAGITEFNAETTTEKGTLSLRAFLKTTVRKSIDVAKLVKLISHEQFMRCVSATQKAVTDVAGGEVATQASVEVPGTENVSVSPVK